MSEEFGGFKLISRSKEKKQVDWKIRVTKSVAEGSWRRALTQEDMEKLVSYLPVDAEVVLSVNPIVPTGIVK